MEYLPEQTAARTLQRLVTEVLRRHGQHIADTVERARASHPSASDREIARRVVRSYQRRAGTAGALTSVGGAITLPVTVPAGMLASWVFATQTVLAVATVYGYDRDDEQLLFDLLMVMAADSVKSTFKAMGTGSAQYVTKKAVEKYVTREVMKKINRIVPRKILTKAGEKSLTSFTKLVPLVGAPIGYGVEHFFIKGVGRKAIDWYEPGTSGHRLAAVAA